MDIEIKLSDLETAVNEAYKKFKKENEGSADPRITAPADQFGISVVLTDGTVINAGDTNVPSPLGNISQLPVAAELLQDNTPEELLKKSGACPGGKCEKPEPKDHNLHHRLKHLELQPRLLRAVSAIEPTGDPDGKMDLIVANLTSLLGSAAILDDQIYRQTIDKAKEQDTENLIAESGFYLYDSAGIAVDITSRLQSLTATTEQLATMGATIAADGFNPVTQTGVFDASNSPRLVAMMASFGPAHHAHGWLISSGVPALAGFGGGMVGVVPGVMGIAAYSPRLNAKGFSTRAAHAIRYIANRLGINVFSSGKTTIV
ncbi:MAG: glutaminase [Clostridium sp.]|nr:glutaminase [Clostridium sp.]